MRLLLRERALIIVFFLALVAALAGGIWRYGYVQALAQLEQRGQADLRLAGDRLTRNLQRFQELAVLLADHPTLAAVHAGGDPRAARQLLLEAADKTSARNLIYVDASGRVLASAQPGIPVGLAQSIYFRRAMQGALGAHHDVTGPQNNRAYYFAAPSFGPQKRAQGALIVIIDVEAVEFEWRGGRPAVFFTDDLGDIFVSNRTEMLLWSRTDLQSEFVDLSGAVQRKRVRYVGPFEMWQIEWGPYLPKRALHLVLPLPVIGLTGEALIDVAPALRLAGLQAAIFAALSLAVGALLFLVAERRRVLAVQNAKLEQRVMERTEELRAVQSELVQAGKLSALGQMSAGISHELNQPLMAIRSFAENSTLFLQRGQTEIAAENLTRISELARRMGRIIKNLRAFARNESEAIATVDLVGIIEGALDLSAGRRREGDVALEWDAPHGPVLVRAGEVRLGQVFLNLITNACDAMDGLEQRRLSIKAERKGARVFVEVADTGPGIEAPDRIFDPFYTTKKVGASEGMGLGLSISYGLVQSFGGEIKGENRPKGGALFTLELDSAADSAAGGAAEGSAISNAGKDAP
ncbi:ATP-binding protein [Planktotalea arctica]|uniref:ATP-binding protein n=1 Tax=Planktotalea arctica TaxID=1481893 RepID=UPI000A16D464|nr:ATP-binding protein [Planktotalea arctica]